MDHGKRMSWRMWALTNPYLHFDLFFVSSVREQAGLQCSRCSQNEEKPNNTRKCHQHSFCLFTKEATFNIKRLIMLSVALFTHIHIHIQLSSARKHPYSTCTFSAIWFLFGSLTLASFAFSFNFGMRSLYQRLRMQLYDCTIKLCQNKKFFLPLHSLQVAFEFNRSGIFLRLVTLFQMLIKFKFYSLVSFHFLYLSFSLGCVLFLLKN